MADFSKRKQLSHWVFIVKLNTNRSFQKDHGHINLFYSVFLLWLGPDSLISVHLSACLIVEEADERANWWLSEGDFYQPVFSPSANVAHSGNTARAKQLIMVKAAETNW